MIEFFEAVTILLLYSYIARTLCCMSMRPVNPLFGSYK